METFDLDQEPLDSEQVCAIAVERWPDESFTVLNGLCVWYGDFRETRYESGIFAVSQSAFASSRSDAGNGSYLNESRHAVKDGVIGIVNESRFCPAEGHADHGDAEFVADVA